MSAKRLHRFLGLVLLIVGGFGPETNALADSSAGHVYLSGQLNKQGAVEIPQGGTLTVAQAIIADGGLSDFADPQKITVLRKKSDGRTEIIPVNLNKILGSTLPNSEAAHMEKDVALKSGDIIVVPQRPINQEKPNAAPEKS